jgi:hypothetical protein
MFPLLPENTKCETERSAVRSCRYISSERSVATWRMGSISTERPLMETYVEWNKLQQLQVYSSQTISSWLTEKYLSK